MSEQKTVGSMTDRQRHALAAMLNSADSGRAWSDPWVTDSLMRGSLMSASPATTRVASGHGHAVVGSTRPLFNARSSATR
jgi:hypothetical protein